MSFETLYIIGNGFDLYHGIQSKYSDFKDFVESDNFDLLLNLEKYLSKQSLWSDFEMALSYLDRGRIVYNLQMKIFDPYGPYDDDVFEDNIQDIIDEKIYSMSLQLHSCFVKWILQLQLNLYRQNRILLKSNSFFLKFNYTQTLERLYNIDQQNIFYIHNRCDNLESQLILGHNRSYDECSVADYTKDYYEYDDWVDEGGRVESQYFHLTYKPVNDIIAYNKGFFHKIKNIKEIFILGHSLSEIDINYFKKIATCIDLHSVKWKVSVFDNSEIQHHMWKLEDIGIRNTMMSFDRINELHTNQLKLFTYDNN